MNSEIDTRKETEKALRISLNEKKVLLREVHHRVKNNLQVVIGLLNLQQYSIADPQLREVLAESQNRIYSMAMVHELIYQTEDLNIINLHNYLEQLSSYLIKYYQTQCRILFKFQIQGVAPKVEIETAIPCGLILNELITNACKHAFRGRISGIIILSITNIDNKISITVEDDGVGFAVEMTSNSLKRYNSIGLKIIHNLCQQLNAEFRFENKKPGTKAVINFNSSSLKNMIDQIKYTE